MSARSRTPARTPRSQHEHVFRSYSTILNNFIPFATGTGSDNDSEPSAINRWLQPNPLPAGEFETEECSLAFRIWFEQEFIETVMDPDLRVFRNSTNQCPLHMARRIASRVLQCTNKPIICHLLMYEASITLDISWVVV